jgi:hypothetical protein
LVQTDEEYFREGNAARSDRRQVLDGVVTYSEALAIVLENKPRREDIWDGQLDVNVPPDVSVDETVACVTWKDIISAWTGLLGAGHLGVAEAVLLGDFLDYVETHFPRLQPYSKIGFCGGDAVRLTRRCKTLLEEAFGQTNVRHNPRWAWYALLAESQSAKMMALMPRGIGTSQEIILEVDPGDTMRQASTLFGCCNLGEILELRTHNWTVEPNFHIAHMNVGLVWMHTSRPIEEYWAYWQQRMPLSQVQRAQFHERFDQFVQEGFASNDDLARYSSTVLDTNRQTYNLCPGLTLRWKMGLDDAATLDERGQLAIKIREEAERAAAALKLNLPPVSGQ